MVRQSAERSEPYEIVFVDWQMPSLDGIETSKRILALPALSAPPRLVMVTAYGREDVLKQAEENGLENVLVKPVTSSTLFDTIVAILHVHGESGRSRSGFSLFRNRSHRRDTRAVWSKIMRSIRKSQSASSKMPRSKSI